MRLEEEKDVQSGSLNHWKRLFGMVDSQEGWEVFTVEDSRGNTGGEARTSSCNHTFVEETTQSRWVMEFLRSIQLTVDEQVGDGCAVKMMKNTVNSITQLPSGSDPGPITEEELAFGGSVGFPTERHPAEYRCHMQREDDVGGEIGKALCELGLDRMIGDYEIMAEQRAEVESLIYTWRDLFVVDPVEMPVTDLVMHTIPTHNNARPVGTKEIVYSQREIQWQRENIPKLLKAGVISYCDSPWSAQTKHPVKRDGTLRLVNIFCPINRVTN